MVFEVIVVFTKFLKDVKIIIQYINNPSVFLELLEKT